MVLASYHIINPTMVLDFCRGIYSLETHGMLISAAEAMRVMNSAILGSKQVVVRLHEPKQLRQEKLAQRFAHNGHPRRSSSGATSPAASEAGDFSGWNSPRTFTQSLASPALSPKPVYAERPDRGRRGSGSYYNVNSNLVTHRCSTNPSFYRRLSTALSRYLLLTTPFLHCPL